MKLEQEDGNDADVTLDTYNSDLNLVIDASKYSAHPLTNEGFAFMWAGARATYGSSKGKFCFEVKVLEHLDVSHLPADEPNPQVVRVGLSVESTSLQLGEEPLSYGYGGTGKTSVNCQFNDYGEPFIAGDCILCTVDFELDQVQINYAKNGIFLGSAFSINKSELEGKALFPHILTKNCAFEVNFGQKDEPYFELPNDLHDYTFIGCLPVDERVSSTRSPKQIEDCEMIMMCGLPGAGKSVWAAEYSSKHPEKKYNVLGTNNIIDKMKVMGLPRKRNYHGRWDVLIQMATRCLNKLFEIGSKLKRNYILDQTNVYPTAQRRKMRTFEGFKRIAVVVVPPEEEYKSRCEKRDNEEGKEVPDHAVLEMMANFKLPEIGDTFDDVIFTDLPHDEADILVKKYNEEGKEAIGPYRKMFKPNEAEVNQGFDIGQDNIMSNRGESSGDTQSDLEGFDNGNQGFGQDSGRFEGSDGLMSGIGEFDGGRGGFDGKRGAFERKRGGFEGRRGGYEGRKGGFDDRRRGFDGRRGGFDGRRGGFDGGRRDFYDRRGDFYDRRDFYDRGGFYDERGDFYDERGDFYDERGDFYGGRGDFYGGRGYFYDGRGDFYDGRRDFYDGRERFSDERGGFDDWRGGFVRSRVGFYGSRGGYNHDRGGFESDRGGYEGGRRGKPEWGRGGRGSYDYIRGGWGREHFPGGRGNFDSGNHGVFNHKRSYDEGPGMYSGNLDSDNFNQSDSQGGSHSFSSYYSREYNAETNQNREVSDSGQDSHSRWDNSNSNSNTGDNYYSNTIYSENSASNYYSEYGNYADYNTSQSAYNNSDVIATSTSKSIPSTSMDTKTSDQGAESSNLDSKDKADGTERPGGKTSRWSTATTQATPYTQTTTVTTATANYATYGISAAVDPAASTGQSQYTAYSTYTPTYPSVATYGYQPTAMSTTVAPQQWPVVPAAPPPPPTSDASQVATQVTPHQAAQWAQYYQQAAVATSQYYSQFYGQAAGTTAVVYAPVYSTK